MTRCAMTIRGAIAIAVAMIAVSAGAGVAVAQSADSASSHGSLPRTPWGDPDLQGTWTTDDTIGVPVERPPALGNKLFLTDEDLAQRKQQQEQARLAAAAAVTDSHRSGTYRATRPLG